MHFDHLIHRRQALVAASLLPLSGWAKRPSPSERWPNPLIPQRADPHLFRHSDGWFYLMATVPEYDRLELRRARTLEGLADAECVVIWRKHEQGAMSVNIWAPESTVDGSSISVLARKASPGIPLGFGRWHAMGPIP